MQLTDEQWELVEPFLTGPKRWKPGGPGRPPLPSRSVVEGILWVMRTGAPWRDMPRRYPSSSTCFRRFEQWRRDGALQQVLALLCHKRSRGHRDEAFIDGTYILAKGGGACVGRSRGGTTTKLMAIADAFGLPVSVCIAEGNRHDVSLVDQSLDASFGEYLAPLLIGDKAFDSKALAKHLRYRSVELVAPRRGGRRPTTRKPRWSPLASLSETLEGRASVCLVETLPSYLRAVGAQSCQLTPGITCVEPSNRHERTTSAIQHVAAVAVAVAGLFTPNSRWARKMPLQLSQIGDGDGDANGYGYG